MLNGKHEYGMPEQDKPRRRLNVDDKRRLCAAKLQLFVKATGRKAQKGKEPNDRRIAREATDEARRMRPADFDQLLRDGEDG
jgi:hypothetical protein